VPATYEERTTDMGSAATIPLTKTTILSINFFIFIAPLSCK
jgi:hypothetical protein